MSKCGKGCMPECEYFMTGGCISPFNCPYKIETGYINSATSIPTYMEQYNGMSDDDIERCLERFATCKTTDVMNFDYSGTLAYLNRLKSENAAMRERLKKMVELPCKIGDKFYVVNDCPPEIKEHECCAFTFTEDGQVLIIDGLDCHYSLKIVYLSKEDAEARLVEFKGE